MTVFAYESWKNNGHLMAKVAELGYLDGAVFDATYGEGVFWKRWKPETLVTNDQFSSADICADFRKLPFADNTFDSVVFDPPYKLSGTPMLGQFDTRYGTDVAMPWQERMRLILSGAAECFRVTKGFLLVKCQDQVCSGEVRWQTDEVWAVIRLAGGVKVDRFDFLKKGQPQPKDRRQVHARRNASQLLVFKKES